MSYGDYGHSSPDDYFDTDRPRGRRKSRDEDEGGLGMPEREAPRVFKNLAEVDMDRELTDQIAEATSYRDYVLKNSTLFEPRVVTDTIKTVNSILANAIKMRESVQNLQRMKAFEDAVVEIMKKQPEEVRAEFFAMLKPEFDKSGD